MDAVLHKMHHFLNRIYSCCFTSKQYNTILSLVKQTNTPHFNDNDVWKSILQTCWDTADTTYNNLLLVMCCCKRLFTIGFKAIYFWQ